MKIHKILYSCSTSTSSMLAVKKIKYQLLLFAISFHLLTISYCCFGLTTIKEHSFLSYQQKHHPRYFSNKYTFKATSIDTTSDNDSGGSIITAGENDKLPKDGLILANRLVVLPSARTSSSEEDLLPIYLLSRSTGWGSGVHPTTRLCIEWLVQTIQGNEIVLDYGCGSGILSIASLRLGAGRVIGVDVEYEALTTAEENLECNEYSDFFETMHVREVTPFGISPPVDICVANILIGQLVRPSMVSALITNMKPNALLCLSGIRPQQVPSLKQAYDEYIDWIDEDDHESTLAAKDTEGSFDSYGFDVGIWCRVIGRRKGDACIDLESMSELAVS